MLKFCNSRGYYSRQCMHFAIASGVQHHQTFLRSQQLKKHVSNPIYSAVARNSKPSPPITSAFPSTPRGNSSFVCGDPRYPQSSGLPSFLPPIQNYHHHNLQLQPSVYRSSSDTGVSAYHQPVNAHSGAAKSIRVLLLCGTACLFQLSH